MDGRIDRFPIVAELSQFDSSYEFRYFYLSQRKDIRLSGSPGKNGSLELETPDRGDEKMVKEKILLVKNDTGYSGTWKSGSRTLRVELGPLHEEKHRHPYADLPGILALRSESDYEYIRTSGFVFSADTKPPAQQAGIRWTKEKYSGISFPRLTGGYDTAVIRKINQQLLERQLIEAKNKLECEGSPWAEYELTAGGFFLHPHVFSFEFTVSYYCGGAHPDFGSEGLNFDGHTGRLLTLDEVFWFSKTRPPSENSDDWYTYREEKLAPTLVSLLKATYPKQMQKPAGDEDCDYSDPGVWQFPNWHFTKKGLYVGCYFARVARNCDQPGFSVIPYRLLRPYLNAASGLILPP